MTVTDGSLTPMQRVYAALEEARLKALAMHEEKRADVLREAQKIVLDIDPDADWRSDPLPPNAVF